MIITCKKQVPFHWIAFSILPWASLTFNSQVFGVAFFFSLRKFIDNPAGVTFILSLPSMLSMLLQPLASFMSDRIWTRFGRRKPFILTSLLGVMTCLALMPLMPSFWTLVVLFIVYNAFLDLNSPLEPLKQEIIPPHERGRATGAMSWCSNLGTLIFYFIALGRFDDVRYMGSFALSGETAIYWSAATLLSAMILLIALGIREVDQKSALRGQSLTFRTFFAGLLDRELWPVFMLVVGSACLNFYSGLGPLSNFLYTEQWGYTKQEMGINVAVGGVINLFVIGVLTLFADKLNRMRAYQFLICLAMFCQISYYSYVNFVLPDKRPSLVELIVFGEVISIIGMLTGMVYTPLVYDYIRRNKMGTYNAGAQMITRLTVLITLNGVGLFVNAYSHFFQPPSGEMTRLVLRGDENRKEDLLKALRASSWNYPQNQTAAPAHDLHANAWQATGTIADTGRCWEIRLRNDQSAELAAQVEKLKTTNSPLLAEEKMLRDEAALLERKGRMAEAGQARRSADEKKRESDSLSVRIEEANRQLSAYAEKFHGQVLQSLGDKVLQEGEQILGATNGQAILLEMATNARPDSHLLERMLKELRAALPAVIDLRPMKRDEGYGVSLSARLETTDERALLAHLKAELVRIASRHQPELFASGAEVLDHKILSMLSLELMVVESPVDNYVSPINRVVNAVMSLFGQTPEPDRRLIAMARKLRLPKSTNHVRAEPGSAPKSISVTAVFPEASTNHNVPEDAITARLKSLLAAQWVGDGRTFYDRILDAGATQKITVARPTLTHGYAPMKHDYMSGYLWMFVMGSFGIIITFIFRRMEAKGLVHKRGVEEAQAS